MKEPTPTNTWDFDWEDTEEERKNRQFFTQYDKDAYYGCRSQLDKIYNDIDRMKKRFLKKTKGGKK